jgi:hypothetical protein
MVEVGEPVPCLAVTCIFLPLPPSTPSSPDQEPVLLLLTYENNSSAVYVPLPCVPCHATLQRCLGVPDLGQIPVYLPVVELYRKTFFYIQIVCHTCLGTLYRPAMLPHFLPYLPVP